MSATPSPSPAPRRKPAVTTRTAAAAAAARHLKRVDPDLFGPLLRIHGPLHPRLRPRPGFDAFPALLESIVYQQLHGRAAATIATRVQALFGNAWPTPEALAACPAEMLRGAGLSAGKLAAFRDLTAHALAGRIPDRRTLGRLDDAAIIERLTVVRGIGPWTVEMLLIFDLGRPDVLPVTDYGVRAGFARASGMAALPTPRELAARGAAWAPFRSSAALLLWKAADTRLPTAAD